MKRGWVVALALGAYVLLGAPAAFARPQIVAIEATAPLEDRTDEAINAAIGEAVRTAARGALAMGLPWLRIQGAYVRGDYVAVKVVATDEEPEPATDETGREPGGGGLPIGDPSDGGQGDTVITYRL